MPHYDLPALIMLFHMRKKLLNLNEKIMGKSINVEVDALKLQTLTASFVLLLVGIFYFCL